MKKNFIDHAKEFWHNEDGFIALAAMAIGAAISAYGQVQEGAANKKLGEARAQQSKIEAARERTRQIRAARVARAQVVQAGSDQGVSDSSGVKAGAAGAMTQAFNNIQGINYQESGGKAISVGQQGIINARGVQSAGQGLAALGGTISNNKDELNDIFGVKKEDSIF